MDQPRIAIIGCGLMGHRRAEAARAIGAPVVAACDSQIERAKAIDPLYATDQWLHAVLRRDVDLVIVATPHQRLFGIAATAAGNGKHVLVEKPGARTFLELDEIALNKSDNSLVRVGYSLRYHPALQQARRLVDQGAIGPLMYTRGVYGHGGRLGYEREWRMQEDSGGGELLDQGTHLIDLARWFLGDLRDDGSRLSTSYWPSAQEDNAFLQLRTLGAKPKRAFLHASCTEWKNRFQFEIFGERGKIEITGLGGSYGMEQCTIYKMKPKMGPPDRESWPYPKHDNAFVRELAEFICDIKLNRQPVPGLVEARAVLKITDQIDHTQSGR